MTTEIITGTPADLEDGDLAIWPIKLADGSTIEIEETEEKPNPPRAAPKGQGKYDHIFNRMQINSGGLKIGDRQAAKTVDRALRVWLKRNGKQGRPTIQQWPDGYRVFWVSQGVKK